MTRARRPLAGALLGTLLTALGLLLVSFLWVGGASADRPGDDEDAVRLSADRVHWTDSLSEPLFDPDVHWSPGESGHRVLYVRNDGPRATRVELAVGVRADDDAAVPWAVLAVRADASGWTSLRGPDSTTLLRSMTLPPGQLRRVELDASLDPRAAGPAMAKRLSVAVDVRVPADRVVRVSPPDPWLRCGTAALGGGLALAALVVARSSKREPL